MPSLRLPVCVANRPDSGGLKQHRIRQHKERPQGIKYKNQGPIFATRREDFKARTSTADKANLRRRTPPIRFHDLATPFPDARKCRHRCARHGRSSRAFRPDSRCAHTHIHPPLNKSQLMFSTSSFRNPSTKKPPQIKTRVAGL